MHSDRFVTTLFLLFFSVTTYGQQQVSFDSAIIKQPRGYYSTVNKKLSSIDSRLKKASNKYLKELRRRENNLKQQLQEFDSTASDNLFLNSGKEYEQFSQEISGKVNIVNTGAQEYIPYLDSLGTSLKFLNRFGNINIKAVQPLQSLRAVQDKLQQSAKIKAYVSQRKEQVKEVLSKYTKLPASLKKQFEKLSKTAYYYSAQVTAYKEMLKDPSKAERKALTLLNKISAFQNFMKRNSQLATMFGQDNPGMPQSLAGLQTRALVQTQIQERVAAGGPNGLQIIQQNIAQAQGELNKLKNKVAQFGGGGSDINMPDFTPNSQKTKSLLKRIEYGVNLQFAKSSSLFPAATSLGLSMGYKVNDKSILGIGLSYKMGMGTLKHIAISHQGVGLRTFVEYKIASPLKAGDGSLFLSGGYEMNYNASFKNITQLKKYNEWQNSALIGLSKKYKVSKKVKGNMQLLYDFLANRHIPVTQPLVFRLGYCLQN